LSLPPSCSGFQSTRSSGSDVGRAFIGYALFCNYLALYLLIATLAVMFYCLARIEERELRGRFGAEYDAYCARVARFIPKLRT
jgi:protein-S-isoprenylcysteine O-methyltransferase Ste14